MPLLPLFLDSEKAQRTMTDTTEECGLPSTRRAVKVGLRGSRTRTTVVLRLGTTDRRKPPRDDGWVSKDPYVL